MRALPFILLYYGLYKIVCVILVMYVYCMYDYYIRIAVKVRFIQEICH